jgi:hypothetical protein
MTLCVANKAVLNIPELNNLIEHSEDKWDTIYGFLKVVSEAEWVLTESDSLANVWTAKLKHEFKPE